MSPNYQSTIAYFKQNKRRPVSHSNSESTRILADNDVNHSMEACIYFQILNEKIYDEKKVCKISKENIYSMLI